MKPKPPCTCTASVVTRNDISLQKIFAAAAMNGSGNGLAVRQARYSRPRAASMSLNMSASFQRMPWKSAIGLPKIGALAHIVHRLVERALRQAERDRRIQATLRIERAQQLAKAVFPDHQIFQRQFAVVELDLVQVLAAHGVVGAGDLEALGVGLQQHAADALAARLAVDAAEHDEHAGLAARG